MKRLTLRLAVAILAFGFGVVLDRLLTSPKPGVQQPVRCDPARIEVSTVFVPAPLPPPHTVMDFDEDSAPPIGNYEIAGKTPRGLEDFSELGLWPDFSVQDFEVYNPVINTDENDVYTPQRTLVALVTQRRVLVISESTSNKEFGYRFDGEFIQAKNLTVLAETGKPILRGTLTKTRNGRAIAEHAVSLRLSEVDRYSVHCTHSAEHPAIK